MNSLRVACDTVSVGAPALSATAGIVMLSLNVVPREDRPLTDQICTGVKRQIDDRQLRPGTRLPSIRTFAEA